MSNSPQPLDLKKLQVYPLARREILSRIEEVLVDPAAAPAACSDKQRRLIDQCAQQIRNARSRHAGVMLLYGAHLVKNGGAAIVERLMAGGWITHLATNGAGSIHDWEFAFQGWSTEGVAENVATGTFGAWEETGRNINLALLVGGIQEEGYGTALGRFIQSEGTTIPEPAELEKQLRESPDHPLSPARAELLLA